MYAFVYTRKKYNRVLVGFVVAWAVLFVVRVTLYLVLGHESFFMSSGHRLLNMFANLSAGAAITMMVIKRRAVRVPQVPGGVDLHVDPGHIQVRLKPGQKPEEY